MPETELIVKETTPTSVEVSVNETTQISVEVSFNVAEYPEAENYYSEEPNFQKLFFENTPMSQYKLQVDIIDNSVRFMSVPWPNIYGPGYMLVMFVIGVDNDPIEIVEGNIGLPASCNPNAPIEALIEFCSRTIEIDGIVSYISLAVSFVPISLSF